MAVISAGLLMYRINNKEPEVFLVHPGGPFFKSKDLGAWTIPKGMVEKNEDYLQAAIREFNEETGIKPEGTFQPLGMIKQLSGKIVYAWAIEKNIPANYILKSNLFEMELPKGSGKKVNYPEIDKAEFFTLPEAQQKIIKAQLPFIERLVKYLNN